MEKSIFKVKSLSREKVKWEDHSKDLTPCHVEDGMWFKREDFFAPLGYGGINGSKLRQAIWLCSSNDNMTGLVNGTVVGSPQSPMAAAVALHWGMETVTVLGASKPSSCIRHPMIKMAAWFGSSFDFVGSAYNSTIQPQVRRLEEETGFMMLEYGITLDHKRHSAERITSFHDVGAYQVQNIPEHIKDLIIPFGSSNSATSIMHGLRKYGTKNLERVHFIRIGPDKAKYYAERMALMGDGLPDVEVLVHDTYDTKIYAYADMVPHDHGEIELHPRYEGKVMEYVKEKLPHLICEDSLFWIVGSAPEIWPMMQYCPELGVVPKDVGVYGL